MLERSPARPVHPALPGLLPSVASRVRDEVPTIEPDDSLEAAEAALRLAAVDHLPVTERGRLCGMVSLSAVLSGEIVAAEEAREQAREFEAARAWLARVSAVMSPPVAVEADTPIVEAAELVCRHHLSCLPVVEELRLRGVLPVVELVRYAVERIERDRSKGADATHVGDLMTPGPVVMVRAGDPLEVALLLMRHGQMRHLLVTHRGELLGILTRREALMARRSRRGQLVGDVMTAAPLVTTEPGADLAAAGRLLCELEIGALPVLSGRRLAGMLTKSDFVAYLVEPAAAGSD